MAPLWGLALFSSPWASRRRLAGKGAGVCVGAGRGEGSGGSRVMAVVRRSWWVWKACNLAMLSGVSSVSVVKDSKWEWR